MSRWLHRFNTVAEYTTARNNDYLEPWVSYTEDNAKVNYNKSEYEKLLETPLTFEITGGGNIVWKASDTALTKTIEYSKDNGTTWTSITSTTDGIPIDVESGNTVQLRGNNTAYGTSSSYNTFSGSTAQFKVKGNIMSLINPTNFSTLTTLESNGYYAFRHLFYKCTGLTDASKLLLPATTLADYCYYYMFRDCTGLTTAPSVLPATTLASGCYMYMFRGCTNLTTAPELPATTLANYCCSSMFWGCTSLRTAPELPATTLAYGCYNQMFYGCTALTSVPALSATTLADYCCSSMFQNCASLTAIPSNYLLATALTVECYVSMFRNCTSLVTTPELPATTLANSCYDSMFQGCTSLTTTPELSATTLVTQCYKSMFQGCTNLNYIKCLATDISATDCTANWVNGVAASGTFVKAASMTGWTTGTRGIPTGWTRVDA